MRFRCSTRTSLQRSWSLCARPVEPSMSVKRKVTVPVFGLLIAALGSKPKGTGLRASRDCPAESVDRPTGDGEDEHRECDCADEELELHGQQDDGLRARRR